MGFDLLAVAVGVGDKDFDPSKIPGSTQQAWLKLRSLVILRAEGKCEICHRRTTTIDVHHRDGCGLHNTLDNLFVCCKSCHHRIHAYTNAPDYYDEVKVMAGGLPGSS